MTVTRIGSISLPSRLGGSALVLAAALAFSAPAAADDEPVTDAQYEAVRGALESRGYSDVSDAEMDDGRIEVDAVHPDGHEVDLEVDPESLEILSEERE